jgi:hypothetical protein
MHLCSPTAACSQINTALYDVGTGKHGLEFNDQFPDPDYYLESSAKLNLNGGECSGFVEFTIYLFKCSFLLS